MPKLYTNPLTTAAIFFARRGWRVFPLDGKHPRTEHGCKDATTDEATIQHWWTTWPTANVGIATGAESGIVVIDLDGQDIELPDIPRTITAKTARGKHLYFTYPAGVKIGNRVKIHKLPIDVRGDGGYVVAPPSIHPDAKRSYEWLIGPDECDLEKMPPALIQWITTRATPPRKPMTPARNLAKRVRAYLEKCPPAVAGDAGHNTAFAVVCAVVNGFALDADTALELLQGWNGKCDPPWNDAELTHKIDDALLLPHEKPWGHLLGTPPNASQYSTPNKTGAADSTYRNSQGKGMGTDLPTLKAFFKKHYYYSDDDVIDVVLGVVAGNGFDSDPIWLHLISPPSGGKTELLYSIFDLDETYFLSDFTPAALISGFRDDDASEKNDEPGTSDEGNGGADGDATDKITKDYSLLPKLDGKVVVTKDFSIIHDKPSEARSQILSILRDVYDGYASRALGNSEPKGFHARFNYLTGMTPDIEKSWSLNTLGERFLMYRIRIENRREHAKRALNNVLDKDKGSMGVRKMLQAQVKAFMDSLPTPRLAPKVDDAMIEKIIDLAELLSTCRTYVHRERNDDMTCLPQAELAARVSKQLMRVGQSVALVRGKATVTNAEFAIMRRIALDSLPTNRRQLLTALWNHRASAEPLDTFAKEVSRIAKTTVSRELENLAELGAVKRVKKQVAVVVVGKTVKTMKNLFQLTANFVRYCENVGGIPPS